jgi:hypothetical protein
MQAVFFSAFGVLMCILFYVLSLPAHRDAGKIFRAAVDLAIPQFTDWVKEMPPGPLTELDKAVALHAYLATLQTPAPPQAERTPSLLERCVSHIRSWLRRGNGA